MSEFSEFIANICKLRKQSNYTEALAYFKNEKNKYDKELISKNVTLISELLNCLRKTKAYQAGFKLLEIYCISIDDNTHERIIDSYAWLLYDYYKTTQINIGESIAIDPTCHQQSSTRLVIEDLNNVLLFKIAEVLEILRNFETEYSATVIEFLFKITARYEKRRVNPPWKIIVRLCENIQVNTLSEKCGNIEIQQKNGLKNQELASAREEWYSLYSKALFETNQFEESYKLSKLALQELKNYHYSNNIWFSRRIALCLKAMGNIEAAIFEMEKLMMKKRDWFILKELASFHSELKNTDIALKLACEALLAYGNIEYKVELIELTGDLFFERSETTTAYQHYLLEKLVREKFKWKVTEQLLSKLNKATETSNETYEFNLLLKKLEQIWKTELGLNCKNKILGDQIQNSPILQLGKISKLLAVKEYGQDGFIKTNTNASYYFFIKKNNIIFDKLKVGLSCEFETLAQKNGKGDVAVHLKIVHKLLS